MFLEVKNATYLKNYEIELFFNDGVYKNSGPKELFNG